MSSSSEKRNAGRLLVITYHYVREAGGPYPGIHPVSAETLGQQIDFLLHCYHPASVQEVHDFALSIRSLERDSFFLTFDDGLQDHYVVAREVLNHFQIKSAFFIPTRPQLSFRSPTVQKVHWLRAHIEPSGFGKMLNRLLPDQWSEIQLSKEDKRRASEMHIHDVSETQALKYALNFIIPNDVIDDVTSRMLIELGMTEEEFCRMTFMDSEQIRQLASEGHAVAMHGHEHVPLSSLDYADLHEDVSKNAGLLEELLGYPPKWISYPYGRQEALPDDPENFCRKHGLDLGFSLISGFNFYGDNRAVLKRITPNELHRYVSAER